MCNLKSVQADPSLRTSFIVGFAMHRLMRDLFVQTLMLRTLGTIFSRRHFEIFFSFFLENRICISCKLSLLHEMTNPVFLVMKKKKINKINNEFNLLSAELAQRAHFEDAFPHTMRLFYSLNKLQSWFCISNVEDTKTEHFTWKRKF